MVLGEGRKGKQVGRSRTDHLMARTEGRGGFGLAEAFYRAQRQGLCDAHAEGIDVTCPILDEVQNRTRRTTSSACKWHMAVRQGQTCTTKPDSIKVFLARTYRKTGIGMAWLLCRGRKKERMGMAVAELGRIRFGSR